MDDEQARSARLDQRDTVADEWGAGNVAVFDASATEDSLAGMNGGEEAKLVEFAGDVLEAVVLGLKGAGKGEAGAGLFGGGVNHGVEKRCGGHLVKPVEGIRLDVAQVDDDGVTVVGGEGFLDALPGGGQAALRVEEQLAPGVVRFLGHDDDFIAERDSPTKHNPRDSARRLC